MAIWQDYFEDAYISCFHYLVKKKLHWTERLFWLITIFICMGSTYYLISKCVRNYRSQTSVYRADTNYLHWETLFPSVVICEKKTERDRPVEYRSKLNKTLTNLTFNETFLEDIKENALDAAFLWPPILSGTFTNNCPFTVEKCLQGNYSYVMTNIRRNCDELLTYCEYNNVQFQCCTEFLPVNTTFGKCFAFNNYGGRYHNGSRVENPPWKIKRHPGLQEGRLLIESKTSNLVISVLSSTAVPNLNLGKYVFKQSQASTMNDRTVNYHYLNVQIRELGASIARFCTEKMLTNYTGCLKLTETLTVEDARLMNVENRGCRFPDESDLRYFDFYSEANCQIECYIMGQKKFCGCALHTCPVGRSEECNLTGVMCINDNKNILEYTQKECHCLPDCSHTAIHTVGTTIKSVEKSFKWLNKSSTMRYIAVVPAPSLRYIRYTTTSSIDLLVVVGGAVGFFIGFSFLSVAQCFYYLFVRTVTDQYRLIMETRKINKQRMMDENFSLAKAKLRMVKVENDIKDVLKRRVTLMKKK